MRNPFVPTFGASPPLLVGRDNVLDRFKAALEHGPTHPDYTLLVTGDRGSGKTAVLNALEHLARAEGWGVVSVSGSSGRARDELLAGLAGLVDNDRSKMRLSSLQVFGVGGSVERGQAPTEVMPPLLRSALSEALAHLGKRQVGLLLTIDEMQGGNPAEMREIATALQHLTRRELQPLAMVGAGLPDLEDTILADRGITFFQRCGRARLEPLSAEDTRLALERPILDNGGRIDGEALELAVESAGGYPFMVQLVGFSSWNVCEDPAAGITLRHVQAGALEASVVLVDQLLRPIWNGLSEVDRSFLGAMVEDESYSEVADIGRRLGRSSNYVNHYRGRLLRAGVVAQAGRGKLRFTHPAMRDWLRTRPV